MNGTGPKEDLPCAENTMTRLTPTLAAERYGLHGRTGSARLSQEPGGSPGVPDSAQELAPWALWDPAASGDFCFLIHTMKMVSKALSNNSLLLNDSHTDL